MRACPECQFLMDDQAVECKFCGSSSERPEPVVEPEATSLGAGAESLPYAADSSPVLGIGTRSGRLVVGGVVAGVALLVAGVAVTTLSGGDEPTSTGPRVTAVAAPTTAPIATTTTGLTSLTTTSMPAKSGLSGKTVPIGMDGRFTATMPAGTSKLTGDARSTTWGATLPGGSSITFKAQTLASVPARFKTSVGRLDAASYSRRVNADLGVTGTAPRFGAFATGSGAEWDTTAAGRNGRVTLIDGGSMAYLLVLQHPGALPVDDIAAYLAVSASLRPA